MKKTFNSMNLLVIFLASTVICDCNPIGWPPNTIFCDVKFDKIKLGLTTGHTTRHINISSCLKNI